MHQSHLRKKKQHRKKHGRKSKEERAAWLAKQATAEVNLTTYEKKLAAQLTISTNTLWQDIPIEPQWGIKKNSNGKNTFCYGFKGHLAVSTKSQYIVARLMSSGNLSDSKVAIPLLKKVEDLLPPHFTTAIFDASYDYAPLSSRCAL